MQFLIDRPRFFYFDSLAQITPEEGIEFWFARGLQEPLGYAKWENFLTTIMRAVESCKTTGCDPNDHFRGVRKMVRTDEHIQNNQSVRE